MTLAMAVMPAASQTPAQKLAFEVVSIRQIVSDSAPQGARGGRTLGPRGCKGGPPQIDPGRIAFQNNSVYTLITMAYGLDCLNADALDLIAGGPGWVKADQYVIQAVIPEAAQIRMPPTGQMAGLLNGDPKLQVMLRNLLADRFNLMVHREMKEVSAYTLILAKGGSRLTRSTVEGPGFIRGSTGLLASNKMSMTTLAYMLALNTHRPVLDHTALTGDFALELKFTPLDSNGVGDSNSPSLFTALEEQLGLKLEATKDSVEVLVIDSVQKPSEN